MRVAVACDEAAVDLAATVRTFLRDQTAVAVDVVDVELPASDPLDAPEIAVTVAVRLPEASTATSPKTSPGPSRRTVSPSRVTSAVPCSIA